MTPAANGWIFVICRQFYVDYTAWVLFIEPYWEILLLSTAIFRGDYLPNHARRDGIFTLSGEKLAKVH